MGWMARQEPSPQAGTAAGQTSLIRPVHCSSMSLTSGIVSHSEYTSLPADVHTQGCHPWVHQGLSR